MQLKLAFAATASMAVVLALTLLPFAAAGAYSPFLICVVFVIANFAWARLLHLFFRHPIGAMKMDAPSTFAWRIYMFHMMWPDRILPIFVPILLQGALYRLRGARIGRNFFSGGKIVEPELVEIGDDVVLGDNALVTCHEIVGNSVYFNKVRIDDGATIGMHAVVFPGVHVGRKAVVAANSCVKKDTVIGAFEIWGGTPARRIGSASAAASAAGSND